MRQNVTALNQGQQNSLSNHRQFAYQHPQHIKHLLDLLTNQLCQIAVGQERAIS
ncbi:hypothetical protein FDUTEX481_05211 [Tolypothrix sp. PCC 7601]|nr:hypothetical protein FDUTEX481_05211 [Tolypothrix sp. PCC 7601]